MNKKTNKISESEMEIMQVIWRAGGTASSQEVVSELTGSRGWKQNTVTTFLTRLCGKGLLEVQSFGRGKPGRYTALLTEEAYRNGEAVELLNRFYGGSVRRLVASMYDGNVLDEAEIKELREWFNHNE